MELSRPVLASVPSSATIATFGMNKVASLKDWQTVLSLTLPAVLSGAAMVLHPTASSTRRPSAATRWGWPWRCSVGLLRGKSVDGLKAGPTSVRVLALLHLFERRRGDHLGAVVATVLAYLQLCAERRQVRSTSASREMRLPRAAAREPATGGGAAEPAVAAPASTQ